MNAIDNYRKDHGLTYAKMAMLAGFSSRSVVFLHCTGRRLISAESTLKYFRAFGIPLSEIRPDLWPPDGITAPPATPSGSSTSEEASHG